MPYDIFNLNDDWSSPPTQTLEPYRSIIQSSGTGQKIRNITDEIQIKFTSSYVNSSKADEYALIDYFNSHKGRLNAFWTPLSKNYFTSTQDIGSSDTTIHIKDVSPIWLRGYERMCIITKQGDLYYSKIVSITSSLMTIAVALGTAIKTSDISLFGKLIYCRFDQDELQITHATSEISECQLSFVELPKEYPV